VSDYWGLKVLSSEFPTSKSMNKLKTPIGRWQEAIQVPCTNKSKIGTSQAKTTVPIRPNEIALRETPASLTDILVSTSKLAIPTHPTRFFACSKDFKRQNATNFAVDECEGIAAKLCDAPFHFTFPVAKFN
jgi:hypothetical protein